METLAKVADQLEIKEICDKVEINNEEASDNIRPQHGRFKHSCKQCDYYARDRRSLQIHIESQHEDIRYPCMQCDYVAKQKCTWKSA